KLSDGTKYKATIQIRAWCGLRSITDYNGLRHARRNNILDCTQSQPITLYSNGKVPEIHRDCPRDKNKILVSPNFFVQTRVFLETAWPSFSLIHYLHHKPLQS